jgi:hypothetical protein
MRIQPIFDCALPRWFGMVALTLYPFILFAKTKAESHSDFDRETLKHEMVHVRQARTYIVPLLFYIVYVYLFLREAVRWLIADLSKSRKRKAEENFWLEWFGDAYHSNPFELEAYGEEEEDLTSDELEELMAAGAVNVRCLTMRELRRACKRCGIPLQDDPSSLRSFTKPKLRRLLEKHEQQHLHPQSD